jgi:hypothetical protein
MKVIEKRVLKIFGREKNEVMKDWRKCITKSFIMHTLHRILLGNHIKKKIV